MFYEQCSHALKKKIFNGISNDFVILVSSLNKVIVIYGHPYTEKNNVGGYLRDSEFIFHKNAALFYFSARF